MVKKVVEANIDDLRKFSESDKVVYGTDRTLKGLRDGSISRVFLSSNCDPVTREDIKHYCSVGSIDCVELKQSSEEIGRICKKSFLISVVGVVKG